MVGHGTKFGRKREEAIAALLTHRTIEEAAHAIKVAPNTLLRWMKDPEFDQAYREARRVAFGHSVARLQQASTAAVSTLLKVMIDPNSPASAKVRARVVFWITRRRQSNWRTSKGESQNWSAMRNMLPLRSGLQHNRCEANCSIDLWSVLILGWLWTKVSN